MERPSKLADLTLVSKYYGTANYSYPRKDESRSCSPTTHRSSLGSDGSAPGLVDDDSETSIDEDYQYHSHTSEVWNSFWQPERKESEEDIHPKKQYPALLPSPLRRRGHTDAAIRRGTVWPLPVSPNPQGRKPAGSFPTSPKQPRILPPRSTSLVPSWTSSRPQNKPQGPAQPISIESRPCTRTKSPVLSDFMEADLPLSLIASRPLTPAGSRPQPIFVPARPATSCANRAAAPIEPVETIILVQPSPGLPSPDFDFPMPPSTRERPAITRPPRLNLTQQQSFFDDDSDDEEVSEPEVTPRFKFMFHKKSDSESKRAGEASNTAPKNRYRAKTAPSSPDQEAVEETQIAPKKSHFGMKRQGDYFHRMLGRRSR